MSAAQERLAVIGNGVGAMRALDTLLAKAPDRYSITVFGAEPQGHYNRILLSSVLAGEKSADDILLRAPDWYAQRGIRFIPGDAVVEIDRAQRTLRAASGLRVGWDKLLIATGSLPFMLPLPGAQLPGVVGFRDLADVDTMLAAARAHRHAVVIGGGLLGLEAANGLARRGMDVTVVHLLDRLMERQLDAPSAALLQTAMEKRGIRFRLSIQTQAILGETRVSGLRFADGEEIAADLVVMAVGIRPNCALGKSAGLACERALLVDDALCTSDPTIYALGECVQHQGATFGLVAPIVDQARVAGAQLAGDSQARYVQRPFATRLKVSGIDLFSAGKIEPTAGTESLVFSDPQRGVYKRLLLEGNRIHGAILFGDVADGSWYFDLLQKRSDVGALRDDLLFGRAYLAEAA